MICAAAFSLLQLVFAFCLGAAFWPAVRVVADLAELLWSLRK